MLGAGGLFVVALAAYFGRFPVLFWFVVVGLGTAVWCAAAQSFESFMVPHPYSAVRNLFNTVRNRLLVSSMVSIPPSRKEYVTYSSHPSTNAESLTLMETGRSHVH